MKKFLITMMGLVVVGSLVTGCGKENTVVETNDVVVETNDTTVKTNDVVVETNDDDVMNDSWMIKPYYFSTDFIENPLGDKVLYSRKGIDYDETLIKELMNGDVGPTFFLDDLKSNGKELDYSFLYSYRWRGGTAYVINNNDELVAEIEYKVEKEYSNYRSIVDQILDVALNVENGTTGNETVEDTTTNDTAKDTTLNDNSSVKSVNGVVVVNNTDNDYLELIVEKTLPSIENKGITVKGVMIEKTSNVDGTLATLGDYTILFKLNGNDYVSLLTDGLGHINYIIQSIGGVESVEPYEY